MPILQPSLYLEKFQSLSYLSLDTCSELVSIALLHNGSTYESIIPDSKNRHAELLISELNCLITEAGTTFNDFKHLCVTVGPGSFTGIRVGLSAAKGINAATGINLVGITALELKAWITISRSGFKRPVIVLDKFKRNKFIIQAFQADLKSATPPAVVDLPDISALINYPALITGSFADEYLKLNLETSLEILSPAGNPASEAIKLAQFKLQNGIEFVAAEPFYLMEPDAKLPTKKLA